MPLSSTVPRRAPLILFALTAVLFVSYSYRNWQSVHGVTSFSYLFRGQQDLSIANATLGFQTILAISAEDVADPLSWRQKSLITAANRTGLEIHIVQSEEPTESEVTELMEAGDGAHPSRGQALAWIAHLKVLQRLVEARVTSALVLEDDVDWDLSIRRELAAKSPVVTAIRNLTDSEPARLDLNPYGTNFEVLWLGHCGMRPDKPGPNITFFDEAVLPLDQLKVWDHKPFDNIGEHQRQVRLGDGPVCSWAYALTWQIAEKLLTFMKNGGDAFDVQLSNACRGLLSCVTVNPELFNQAKVTGQAGLIDKADGKEVDVTAGAVQIGMLKTPNIRYSARCNAGRSDEDKVQCLPASDED